MRFKRLLSLLLVISLAATVALTGCGTTTGDGGGNVTPAPPADNKTTDSGTDSGASGGTDSGAKTVSHDKQLTIDIYDVAANYQGLQTGWFDKVVKDRFNLALNILAPQVAGDALYQTRLSSGNLGDIVLLEPTQFADCMQNGVIKDITADIGNYKNLMDYKTQIDVYNKGLPGNTAGKIYGIPVQMTNTSPTAYSQDVIYSSPQLRWDLYQKIGAPEIKDLNGLLDALAEIQKVHPKNDDGDPAYAMTLWPDWDGGDNMLGIANVVQLTTWYGEKIKGSVVLKPDNTFYKLTDKTGTYYKMLHFLFDAQNRGLVDPDSKDQDWNAVYPKISAGRVHLLWYSWQGGFWNTQERLADGTAFIFIPVMDQNYYADSDTYYGSGRVIGIGSGVDDEKYARIMEFLDWYASPDGLEFQHIGIEGFNYERGADGKLTIKNENALMDNLPVPAEYGGGGYNDGNNAINQWIVDAISINPKTGEPYSRTYWSTYKAATQTQMKKDWAAKFGAAEPAEWMKKNNKLMVSPNVSVTLPSDPNDIAVYRNACGEVLEEYSWKMIFCGSEDKFNALWNEMVDQMVGNGYDELAQFDLQKWQIELDAKIAAVK
jgi:multiple sugar transport system substrate-binding protein/putative aldouronate transport system substrate-binding protein